MKFKMFVSILIFVGAYYQNILILHLSLSPFLSRPWILICGGHVWWLPSSGSIPSSCSALISCQRITATPSIDVPSILANGRKWIMATAILPSTCKFKYNQVFESQAKILYALLWVYQDRNFIFERARVLPLENVRSIGNFWRDTKAKTRGTRGDGLGVIPGLVYGCILKICFKNCVWWRHTSCWHRLVFLQFKLLLQTEAGRDSSLAPLI